MKKNSTRQYILASKSPRRQQLLAEAGYEFEVRTKSVEENYRSNLHYSEVPGYLATKKAKAIFPEIDQEIIIASDTIVVCEEEILGKPKDYQDAVRMLNILSGKEHHVITGVCLMDKKKEVIFSDTTSVRFKALTSEEINYYINEFQPYDKAGGYGIQEWIGMIGINEIRGSYFTVMGLPIQRLYEELNKF